MPRCAVLGSPIAHSLSPSMHTAAYAHLGLSGWSYDAFDVREEQLPGFLAGLDGRWRGLSLTMPLKRAVVPLLDVVGVTARDTGTVNTVLIDDGRLTGENTDLGGARAALLERGIQEVSTARILGAGATAASIGVAVTSMGLTSVDLRMRDPAHGRLTTELLEHAYLQVSTGLLADPADAPVDLLVSTVPAAYFADDDAARWVAAAAAVFDVVYDPWPTPLARAAADAGVPFVSGLDLLAHQATFQVDLMTGRPVPAAVLRAAALAALP